MTAKEKPKPEEISARTAARLAAVQALYQMDLAGTDLNDVIAEFLDDRLSGENRDETIAAWVYRRQEIVAIGTLDAETRFPASARVMREAGLQSVCAFPLTTAHRKLGSLVMASVRRDAYSLDEVRFCGLVADQIALAMDDAINFRASQKAQERLELLLDLTNRAVNNLNLREVLLEISAHIRKVMQCDGVGIDLPSPEDGKLRIYALDFPDASFQIEEGHEPAADEKTSAAHAFQSGEAVVLSHESPGDERNLS